VLVAFRGVLGGVLIRLDGGLWMVVRDGLVRRSWRVRGVLGGVVGCGLRFLGVALSLAPNLLLLRL